MAKKPASTTPKAVKALAAGETLSGSNTLPAVVEIAPGKSVQLGEIIAFAHAASGLTVEAWNGLAEEERDAHLNKAVADLAPAVRAASPDMTLSDLLGPRVLQEVRYRGRTYSPGEHLPHDIDPKIEDELDEIGAI